MAKTSDLPASPSVDGAKLLVVQGEQTRQLPVEVVLGAAANNTATALEPASGFSLYDPPGDVIPLWTDANLGVLLGVNAATGEAVGLIVDKIRAGFTGGGGQVGGEDMRVFTDLAAAVQPMWTDANLGVLLGINKDTGDPVGLVINRISAMIAAGSSGGQTPAQRGAPLTGAAVPIRRDWNGAISYGQSLSVGAAGQPPLSTVQPYSNLTFNGGPKAAVGANTAATKALVEDTLSEASGTTGNRGETVCSGMANWAVQTAAREAGVDPASFVIFSSAPGQGGQPIASLKKGSTYYTRFMGHVSEAFARATAAGKTYAVHAVSWVQGETNCDQGTARATYLAELRQLSIDIDADIRAITGQASSVHLMTYQTAYKAVSSGGAIALAQKDAVDLGPLIHFVTPIYHLPYNSDGTHSTNVGYLLLGRYFGRAYKQIVIDGRTPDCIWPLSATVKGQTLQIKFSVPKAPLVLDVSALAATVNHGFRVVDDTGTLTLSAIQVVGGDTVQITLDRVLGTNPKARYALDALGTGLNISSGASGNLRDSTPDTCVISGVTKPMFHLAPAFELPILSLDTTS